MTDDALARKAAADLLYAVLLEEGVDRGPTEAEVDRLLARAVAGDRRAGGLREAAESIARAAAAHAPRPPSLSTLGEAARWGRRP